MSDGNVIEKVIKERRSIKPAQMNGKKVPDELVKKFLEMADWAPTHGLTEPWYFMVYSGEKVKQFCIDHAGLYKDNTPEDKFMSAKYEKLLHNGDMASHIIVVAMKRGNNPKITALEEISATAAGVQNILLSATANGVASFWSSGGLTFHPALKSYLNLRDDDQVMGILYLGYSDQPLMAGRRIKPLDEKVSWL